jgi:hypothetical protein
VISEKRAPELSRMLGKQPEIRVTVGIHSEQGERAPAEYKNGITVAEIGEIHEFGLAAPRVPQRSFIRGWFDDELPAVQKDIETEARGLVTRPPSIVAERLALRFQGRLQAWISTPGKLLENAESTKRRKGSSMPLIDHGILKGSLLGRGEVHP